MEILPNIITSLQFAAEIAVILKVFLCGVAAVSWYKSKLSENSQFVITHSKRT